MPRIYKYALRLTDVQLLSMPRGAHFLCVQMQHGAPHLWAMVEAGRFVWHVFAEPEADA